MKKRVVVLLSIIFFLIVSFWLIQTRKSESTVDETDSSIRTIHNGISINQVSDAVVDENNANNIAFYSERAHNPNRVLSNKWLFLGSFETEYNHENKKIADYKNYKMKQYDLLTKKLVYEYDISKFIEEQDSNLQIDFGAEVRRLGSNFLLTIDVATDEGKAYSRSVIINPKTQELSWMDREDLPKDFQWLNSYQPDDYGKQLWILNNFEKTNSSKLLDINMKSNSTNTFDVNISTSDGIHLMVSTSYLPDKNKELYTMFPSIKKYRKEPEGYIIFLLDGQPTPEEILKLFLEDGEEISFEGLILSADSTIDGQEHAISSFEEYNQWRNYGEEEVTVN